VQTPWLDALKQQLAQLKRSERLPHAVLIDSKPGLGGEAVIAELIASVLCNQPDQDTLACGHCRSCQLHAIASHEDLHRIEVPEARASIGIDQIRELSLRLYTTPMRAPRQVVHVVKPERMTVPAANALLKTLEEPPLSTLFVLDSFAGNSLLPTVRSRALKLKVPEPPAEQALAFLELCSSQTSAYERALALIASRGAPMRALEYLERSAITELQAMLEKLKAYLSGELSVQHWLASERARLSSARQLLLALLDPRWSRAAINWPEPIASFVRLTAEPASAHLLEAVRGMWMGEQLSGSGVREDLALIEPMARLRQHFKAQSQRN
jgi:DNA polymerase-3 subunit delta'